ncbi:HupE/UreJ family protein (plasmid) [Rhizobium johnstonii]|nr:HupE/UreJ family protein [Rhizobium johnstonii]
MTRLGALLAVLIPVFLATPGMAHEIRPAYLDMRETAPDEFAVVWKVPAQGDMRLGLYASLPMACIEKAEPVRSIVNGAYLERRTVACAGGLRGGEIGINGLKSTMTEALVRIEYGNGDTEVVRLMPDAPSFTAAGVQTSLEVARTYFLMGVDHILSGLDHLLFVLAIMLLIRDRWMLVKTITAFTIAHSITLAGASLGYFSLPQKPVEATIALSIAFVANELIKMKPGERRLSESYPWVVAFAFGLLHGFGFAGALRGNRLAAIRCAAEPADIQPGCRGRTADLRRRGAGRASGSRRAEHDTARTGASVRRLHNRDRRDAVAGFADRRVGGVSSAIH